MGNSKEDEAKSILGYLGELAKKAFTGDATPLSSGVEAGSVNVGEQRFNAGPQNKKNLELLIHAEAKKLSVETQPPRHALEASAASSLTTEHLAAKIGIMQNIAIEQKDDPESAAVAKALQVIKGLMQEGVSSANLTGIENNLAVLRKIDAADGISGAIAETVQRDLALLIKENPSTRWIKSLPDSTKLGIDHYAQIHLKDLGLDDKRSYRDFRLKGLALGEDLGSGGPQDWKLFDKDDPNDQIPGTDDKAENLRQYLDAKSEEFAQRDEQIGRHPSIEALGDEQERLQQVYDDLIDKSLGGDDARFDMNQSRQTREKILERIDELRQQRTSLYENQRGVASKLHLTDANKFVDEIAPNINSVHTNAIRDEVKAQFEKLVRERDGDYNANYKDLKENANRQIRQRIRTLLENLEDDEGKPWRRKNAFQGDERELSDWIDFLRTFDKKEYKRMVAEEEGRDVLHKIYGALRASESPFDAKNLLHAMSEFDKMELQKAVAEVPGVAEAFKLVDEHGYEFMQYDQDADGLKRLFEKLQKKLYYRNGTDGDLTHIGEIMKSEGISPEAAVRLAHRTFCETGRDAWWYRVYLRSNDCIQFIYNEKTKSYDWHVEPNTPLRWDFFRLIYAPEGIVGFFNMGASLKGTDKTITFDAKYPNQKFEVKMGQGVGADVFKVMTDNDWDLRLPDWYSRRHGHYFKEAVQYGWTQESFIETLKELKAHDHSDKLNNLYTEAMKWSKEFKENDVIGMSGGVKKDVHTEYQKYLREKMWMEFNKYMGTPTVAEAPEEPNKYFWIPEKNDPGKDSMTVRREKIADLRKAIAGGAEGGELTALLDEATTGYETIKKEAVDLSSELSREFNDKYHIKRGLFMPTFANYDIRLVPYDWLNRGAENVRGNWRDNAAASALFGKSTEFVNNPTPQNLLAIQKGDFTRYSFPHEYQDFVMKPMVLAFQDVHEGKGLIGGNPFEDSALPFIQEWLASKYSKATGMKTYTDQEIRTLIDALTFRGDLSKGQRDILRRKMKGVLPGGASVLLGRINDVVIEKINPVYFGFILLAILQEEAKNTTKELDKG